jgi:hypothetical protein
VEKKRRAKEKERYREGVGWRRKEERINREGVGAEKKIRGI